MIGDRLIDFFVSNGTDDRGRVLLQLIGQSDEWLEKNHDFIQWLFPLSEKSGANPNAPLIDVNLVSLFSFNSVAQENMLMGFDRMLSFYGMQRNNKIITKGENWYLRKDNWFVTPTHNDLRITRILKSMSILGLGDYSQALLDTLLQLASEQDCGFSSDAIDYWKSAVSAKWDRNHGMYSSEVEYKHDSKEEVQEGVRSLLQMILKFSELDELDVNEKFRLDQIRYRAAHVAWQTGVMGKTEYLKEVDEYIGLIAGAMGGTVHKVNPH